ncbi:DNA repair protein RAD51 homolog 2-like [Cucurbita pepo subsp. pepo]|uniref:DNA repair protein RAD51 homolog 2-like n=1 Tax=Cucurbita pepo subsp. pepo TaxID=3664 RepID=UPI000C9D45DA|nr:DNA repair protein RAD51 homolog 2-like [Cucurbita pepo subsp. pepo]
MPWFDREIEGDRMTNKLMNQMGLHKSITNIFAERIINTAKEALYLTEFELMELLDAGLLEVASAVAHIIELLLSLSDGLDEALFGGIPFGVLTELVGPA